MKNNASIEVDRHNGDVGIHVWDDWRLVASIVVEPDAAVAFLGKLAKSRLVPVLGSRGVAACVAIPADDHDFIVNALTEHLRTERANRRAA